MCVFVLVYVLVCVCVCVCACVYVCISPRSVCMSGIYLTFIYDGWVGNWARVGYMYVNHGSYNVSYMYACQNSIVHNQFMIHSVVIVTCTNNKSISSVHIHSDAQLMQNYFTL